MTRCLKRPAALCLLALSGICSSAVVEHEAWYKHPSLAPPPPGAIAEAVEWARSHAHPLTGISLGADAEDLEPLIAMIGDARIIGFGEDLHAVHEYLMLRNRLFEFFVARLGVTAIGCETGLTEAQAADDYVMGRSNANPAAYTSVFSWSEQPDVENKQLLDWMRAYNERAGVGRKLRFFGLDLTGGRDGEFTQSRLALDAMLAYVDRVDSALASVLHARIDPLLPRFNEKGYARLSKPSRNVLTGAIADAVAAFERNQPAWIGATSALEYQGAYRVAMGARQLDMNMRSMTLEDSSPHRDSSMARNALAVLEELGPQGRLMVFAQTGHLSKSQSSPQGASLGTHLKAALGDEFKAIGSISIDGAVGSAGVETWSLEKARDSTLNVALRVGAGRDLFFFDTRELPVLGPLADWVDRGEPLRQFWDDGPVRESFDVLMFINTIGPTHLLLPRP